MSEINFESSVSQILKHEYQEGTIDEVQINCAGGKTLMVRFLLHSRWLRIVTFFSKKKLKKM